MKPLVAGHHHDNTVTCIKLAHFGVSCVPNTCTSRCICRCLYYQRVKICYWSTYPLNNVGWKHQLFRSGALAKFLNIHPGTVGTTIAFPTANRTTCLSCQTVGRLSVLGKLLQDIAEQCSGLYKIFPDSLLMLCRVNCFNGVLTFLRG